MASSYELSQFRSAYLVQKRLGMLGSDPPFTGSLVVDAAVTPP